MSKIKLCLLPLLMLSLTSCNKESGTSINNVEEKYTVSYFYNCPKEEIALSSGLPATASNLLYLQEEITLGNKLVKPSEDPLRSNYEFVGWSVDTTGNTLWDFENDIAYGSTLLYAKWAIVEEEEYVEPEYIYPEKIIIDQAFVLEGILNSPINGTSVGLTTGAINRLKNHSSDVKFALNYARKESTSIISATYDVSTKKITVATNEDGETKTYSILVTDTSSKFVLSNSTYEQKAKNYEEKGSDYENYHIMLAGSSSMENWSNSTSALAPIVSYNHGIGGTTVDQWIDSLFERLVMPYSPKAVVFYVGVNNIINAGDNGEATGNKLVTLFNKVHTYLPNTRVFYVLINKLPGYLNRQPQFDIANNKAIEYCLDKDWISCIDAGVPLLKENGEPNAAYFLIDGLHMSQYGYILWGGVVKKALIDWLG